MGLGALLAAGPAAEAAAGAYIEFSGYYRVYGMYEGNLGKGSAKFRRYDALASMYDYTLPARWGPQGVLDDDYFGHRLNIDLAFRPTDAISVHWRLRGPDFRRWGAGNDSGPGLDLATHHLYGLIRQDWGDIHIGRLNEDLDAYGLASLGYAPATDPVWSFVSPFDPGAAADSLRYSRKWDNGFGLMAQYQKIDSNEVRRVGSVQDASYPNAWGDTTHGGLRPIYEPNLWSDRDFDRFIIEPTYEWDGGGLALGLRYDRDAAVWTDWRTGYDIQGDGLFDKRRAWYVNPAVMHSWGGFSLHFEGLAGWAVTEVANPKGPGFGGHGRAAQRDFKEEGYAFFLDADYNYGPGNVTLAAWWASGTELGQGYGPAGAGSADVVRDPSRYGRSKSLAQIDQGNFYPLLVAFNGTASGWGRENNSAGNSNAVDRANRHGHIFIASGLNQDRFLNDPAGTLSVTGGAFWAFNRVANIDAAGPNDAPTLVGPRNIFLGFNEGSSNHWAVNLSGKHAFTDDVSLHYALAYLALNNPNYRVLDQATLLAAGSFSAGYVDQEKDLGFEADLGVTFQLLDNLQFVSSFGYMWNGGAYKSLRGYNYTPGAGPDVSAGKGQAPVGSSIKAVWDDPDNSYVWYNTLTFSF